MLLTNNWMPCWRIVSSTFPRCISFHTGWVERGRIVLAEFGYGGKLLPTFPRWVIDGTRPSRLAWLLKERILPPVYWQGMLKGREWLAAPQVILPSPDTPEVG
jgi:sulfide:quinone oxidoreductase